jgi:GMP synthase (glutamine-hydrolysing)
MAFSLNGSAWGLQFHPEFDTETDQAYIRAEAEALRAEGQDPAALAASVPAATCAGGPVGTTILSRFAALARTRQQ